VIENFHIAEIIREAGPEGIHINEIGKKANQDPAKIGGQEIEVRRCGVTKSLFKDASCGCWLHHTFSRKSLRTYLLITATRL